MAKYMVGTFPGETPRRKPRAYLRDYNSEWDGCIVVEVTAGTGAEAKKIAIDIRACMDKHNHKDVLCALTSCKDCKYKEDTSA